MQGSKTRNRTCVLTELGSARIAASFNRDLWEVQVRMGSHDAALVCLNGHKISGSFYDYPQFNEAYCSICGAKTIHQCPDCQTDIRGFYRESTSFGGDNKPPDYCHNCGKPYPWTAAKLEVAIELIQELDESDEDKEKLVSDLSDLVADTPRTPLAIERMRKVLGKAGGELGKALRDIIVDIGSEAVKKSLFQ
jgi:hypothetical protein